MKSGCFPAPNLIAQSEWLMSIAQRQKELNDLGISAYHAIVSLIKFDPRYGDFLRTVYLDLQEEIQESICSHPETPEDILEGLFNKAIELDGEDDPDCDFADEEPVFCGYAEYKQQYILLALAENKGLSENLALRLTELDPKRFSDFLFSSREMFYERLAENPAIPNNRIIKVYEYSSQYKFNCYGIKDLGKHPNLTPENLDYLCRALIEDENDVPHGHILNSAVSNPMTPESTIIYLAETFLSESCEYTALGESLLANKTLSEELFNKIISKLINPPPSHDSYEWTSILENLSRYHPILETLSHSNNEHMRGKIAENKYTTAEILIRLSDDPSGIVRWKVAKNLNTPPEIIDKLAHGEDHTLHCRILHHAGINPNASARTLEYLIKRCSTNDYVLRAIGFNPNCPLALLSKIAANQSGYDTDQGVIVHVYDGVLENPSTPTEILSQMVGIEHNKIGSDVSAAIMFHYDEAFISNAQYIAQHPNADEQILMKLTQDSRDDNTLTAITHHPKVTREILEIIVKNSMTGKIRLT